MAEICTLAVLLILLFHRVPLAHRGVYIEAIRIVVVALGVIVFLRIDERDEKDTSQ